MRSMKTRIRVLGIDDGPHKKHKAGKALLVGTVMRGSEMVDGVISANVEVDGTDSTEKIVELIKGSHFRSLIRCIFLDGIAVAGFNVIDVGQLYKETGIPVIVIMRHKPDHQSIISAMETAGFPGRYSLIEKAPPPENYKELYIQRMGIARDDAHEIIDICTSNSQIPECLRLSHIIASGIATGHSKGDA